MLLILTSAFTLMQSIGYLEVSTEMFVLISLFMHIRKHICEALSHLTDEENFMMYSYTIIIFNYKQCNLMAVSLYCVASENSTHLSVRRISTASLQREGKSMCSHTAGVLPASFNFDKFINAWMCAPVGVPWFSCLAIISGVRPSPPLWWCVTALQKGNNTSICSLTQSIKF